jgi:hypothetical protein
MGTPPEEDDSEGSRAKLPALEQGKRWKISRFSLAACCTEFRQSLAETGCSGCGLLIGGDLERSASHLLASFLASNVDAQQRKVTTLRNVATLLGTSSSSETKT